MGFDVLLVDDQVVEVWYVVVLGLVQVWGGVIIQVWIIEELVGWVVVVQGEGEVVVVQGMGDGGVGQLVVDLVVYVQVELI